MRKVLVVILGIVFLCLCGCSVRAGYGPYDTANYTDLDARSEIMEGRAEYEEDKYLMYDFSDPEQATEDYYDYIGNLVREEYLMEQFATEQAATLYPTVITPFTPLF